MYLERSKRLKNGRSTYYNVAQDYFGIKNIGALFFMNLIKFKMVWHWITLEVELFWNEGCISKPILFISVNY